MKKNLILVLSIIAIFLSHKSISQNIRFTASAQRVVSVGETFALTFTVNEKASDFKGPNLNNFDVYSGPNKSSSSSIQIINGDMKKSVTNTYTYYIAAKKEGSFLISPAYIKVKGKKHKSNSISIKAVNDSNSQTNNNNNNKSRNNNRSKIKNKEKSNNKDIFLKAYISKRKPYRGEQIIVTYKLFTKVGITNISIDNSNTIPGFWTHNLLKDSNKLQQKEEMINGEKYITAVIRKIALFPLKAGKLNISKLKLECQAQVRAKNRRQNSDPFFDDFFNDSFFGSYKNVKKTIYSNALNINVLPLPDIKKPENYTGAVGKFYIKSKIDKKRLKANEAITIKYIISGKGNLDLVDKIDVEFPPDFESYEPKITNNIRNTGDGISGSRSFEYVVIPRNEGKYAIKPVKFSYFDINKKKYVNLTAPGYSIIVDENEKINKSITYSGNNREDIKYVGSDIRFIETNTLQLKAINKFFFLSKTYFILIFSPLIIFILLLIIWKKQIKRNQNTVLIKNKKATKAARKRLIKANICLKKKDSENFYIEISQALWGYLSDKFNIPLSELSIDSINNALSNKNINQDIIDKFLETLNECEFARFAPGDKTQKMDNIYKKALDIISKTERELK